MERPEDEVLRYLGVSAPTQEQRRQVQAVAEKFAPRVTPRHTCKLFPLERSEDAFVIAGSGLTLTGAMAGKMLADCHQVALLGCTLGAVFDDLLRREQARDMAQAVMLDAWGSVWVERGCDEAEEDLARRLPGRYLTDRFSPGYGDLPLDLQGPLCAALDTPRRLGVCVTTSGMLNPAKSVTALIGISDTPQPARIRGCGHCSMRNTCTYRRGGTTCGLCT